MSASCSFPCCCKILAKFEWAAANSGKTWGWQREVILAYKDFSLYALTRFIQSVVFGLPKA